MLTLLLSLAQAYKTICICNKECSIYCNQNKFNAPSNSFNDFLKTQIVNEKEIELVFYSKEKDFSFPISLSSFGDTKVTIKTINISQPIKLQIKRKFKIFSENVEIKPNHKIILPNLTPIPIRIDHSKNILEGPTYSTAPLSVPLTQMSLEGSIESCNTKLNLPNNCANNYLNLNTYAAYTCGHKCKTSLGNFEYKFKGVKFLLYGTIDSSLHEFDVEVDGTIVKTVNENGASQSFVQVYESDILEYKEHTVRTIHKGQAYELFKLAYWPKLNLRRANSTDFTKISGNWNKESDGIGGVREVANNGGSASITLFASKVWVYGVKDSHLHDFNISFNDKIVTVNQHSNVRQEGVLLYESPEALYFNTTFTFSSSGPMILYSIFYADHQPPVSIGPFTMKHEGRIVCLKSDSGSSYLLSSIQDAQHVGCSYTHSPDSPRSYNCGLLCSTESGSYNYTFKGVKFAIYGSFKHGLKKFIVEFDGRTFEVNEESNNQRERVPVFISENLEYN